MSIDTTTTETDSNNTHSSRADELVTVAGDPTTEPEQLVVEELLVEEVSIDGMCGVY